MTGTRRGCKLQEAAEGERAAAGRATDDPAAFVDRKRNAAAIGVRALEADANRAINATKAPRRRIGIGMPYPLSYQSWLMDTDDSRLFHMTQVTLPI